MNVEELERAVAELPDDDLTRFTAWFEVYRHMQEFDNWDRQIEEDVRAGKLDWLAAEVEADIAAGRARPL